MHDIKIRLFAATCNGSRKAEKHTTMLGAFLLLVQLTLLAYLVLTEGFALTFLWIYLLHVLVFSFLLARIWLGYYLEYRRNLTLNSQGVRYRTGFLEKEHEFDWEEVDAIYLQLSSVEFILKNEESHLVLIKNEATLKQAKQQLKAIALQKAINLTYN